MAAAQGWEGTLAWRQWTVQDDAGPTAQPPRRRRLFDDLDHAVRGRVTVVGAPAGYGKSTLVVHWIEAHPDRIVVHVVLEGFRGPPAPGGESDVHASALQALDAVGEGERILVVDASTAPERWVHDAVVRLDRVLPPSVHTVVVCRAERLAADLRQAGMTDVALLGAEALAFNRDEAGAVVAGAMGQPLSDGELDRLMEATEGWPALVADVAVATRAGEGLPSVDGLARRPRVEALVHNDVLSGLSRTTRRLLRRASPLEAVNVELAEDVLGGPAAASMLASVAHRGLFLRGSYGSDWFVLHPVVREVLRRDLRRAEPGVEERLLLGAAAWHSAHDDPHAAARYLIRAQAWEQLLALADRHGRSLFERGELDLVREWLDVVPSHRHPLGARLALRRACAYGVLGQNRRASHLLAGAEAQLHDGERAVADALRATWVFFDGDPDLSSAAASRALSRLARVDRATVPDVLGLTSPANVEVLAVGSLARSRWLQGDVVSSRHGFEAILQRPNVYPPWRIHSLSAMALLEGWAGNFRLARDRARMALRVAMRHGLSEHAATIDARLGVAHVLREQGHPHRAAEIVDHAEAIATRTRRPHALALCALERALGHLATGHPARGLREIDACRERGDAPAPTGVAERLAAAEIRLHLALNDLARAEAVLDNLDAVSAAVLPAAVQLAMAREDLPVAEQHLARWAAMPVEQGDRLEHHLWAAVMDFERGRRRQALRAAAEVVAAAQLEGRLRLFLDAGRPVTRLLAALARAEPTPYAVRLARASAAATTEVPAEDAIGLSDRELEVLRYLPTPLSSTEIAAQLFISLNTLKTHLRVIYRKLGVRGRHEAVERADELAML